MPRYNVAELKDYAANQASMQGIPPDIFTRMIETESAWNPDAVSPAGAQGIAQLMPGTSEGHVDPFNPFESIAYAAELLRGYFKEFGDWSLALAAYNAGPGNVRKYEGVPPFAETQNYIKKILGVDLSSESDTGERGVTMTSAAFKIAIWSAAIVLILYGFRGMLK